MIIKYFLFLKKLKLNYLLFNSPTRQFYVFIIFSATGGRGFSAIAEGENRNN